MNTHDDAGACVEWPALAPGCPRISAGGFILLTQAWNPGIRPSEGNFIANVRNDLPAEKLRVSPSLAMRLPSADASQSPQLKLYSFCYHALAS
jgi:hypothetical protein